MPSSLFVHASICRDNALTYYFVLCTTAILRLFVHLLARRTAVHCCPTCCFQYINAIRDLMQVLNVRTLTWVHFFISTFYHFEKSVICLFISRQQVLICWALCDPVQYVCGFERRRKKTTTNVDLYCQQKTFSETFPIEVYFLTLWGSNGM